MSEFPWDDNSPKLTLKQRLYFFYISVYCGTMNKIHYFLAHKLNTKVCHQWTCFKFGNWYRQNTAYNDEDSNWVFLCEDCQKENDKYWDEMWADYWSGRL